MNRKLRRQLAKKNKSGAATPHMMKAKHPAEKIKILAYMDSPTVATGFGTVSRNILDMLQSTGMYEISVFGINHWGDPHNFPYAIWPAGINNDGDPYGRKKFVEMALGFDFDILFCLQDTFIMDFLPELITELKKRRGPHKPFKSVVYFPIDGVPKVDWIYNISFCDKLVAYAEFGKKITEDMLNILGQLYDDPENTHPILRLGKDRSFLAVEDLSVINHGVNEKDFFVLPKDTVTRFRKEYFNEHNDKFIFCNVNRNQQRKDIPRTINAFKIFHDRYPDTLLYLHMAAKDHGWEIPRLVDAFGLRYGVDVITPDNFGPNKGYPIELLNHIYNAVDCFVSTTLGEGMGLSWMEAMAVKKPVIVPRNTAMREFITEDTGFLVNSGNGPNLLTVIPNDNEVVRPMADVEHLVEQMNEVYHNKERVAQVTEGAYKWLYDKMLWTGGIKDQWVDLFNKAVVELDDLKKEGSPVTSSVIKAEEI